MTDRKDLLIISYLDYPYYSGLSKRINGIAGVLVKNQVTVRIIAPIARSENAVSDHDSNIDIHRIDLRQFRSKRPERFFSKFLQWLLFSLKSSISVLREVARNRCLVQYQSIYSASAALITKLVMRTKIIGDDIVLVHPIIDTFVLRITDVITTPSPRTYSFAERLKRPVLLVPNGVERSSYRELAFDSRTSRFKHTMLFVGVLSFGQNLKAIANILSLAQNLENRGASFEIIVVGGPLSYADRFADNPIVRRGIVRFVGYVTEDELHRLYSSSFIGLLPFFDETPLEGGQRTKALEFFANNLLVISGPNGIAGIAGLKAGEHYLFAKSLDKMCELVEKCVLEPAKYVSIAKAGAKYILGNHSWDVLAEKYTALISQMVSDMRECGN
jgi:glycosyltransferase involved in cell wall biosynthesis